MFIFAFTIGVFAAILVKFKILDYAERKVEDPGKFWHYLHIGTNCLIGLSLIFLCWSWIIGSLGLGFIAVALTSIYLWLL